MTIAHHHSQPRFYVANSYVVTEMPRAQLPLCTLRMAGELHASLARLQGFDLDLRIS